MLGLIAYGSLINSGEAMQHGGAPLHTVPVKVHTFKRSFSQLPAWRKATVKGCAVLNVQPSEADWLNAVCYCYPDFDFATLDNRERGYTRTTVPLSRVNCYQDHDLPELQKMFMYLGREEHQSSSILPNPDYLDICLKGAEKWGEGFYRDFLVSTHVNNGMLLQEYLHTS